MTGPQPLMHQQSEWVQFRGLEVVPGFWAQVWRRNVHDGRLQALVCEEPEGWHLSISHADNHGNPRRYPTWDEISHARYQLLDNDLDFVMHLPPPQEYVAVHPTTFHLHEHPERAV